jgi:protein-S-isoprenylcysteine O-methyltransferase Ste14
MTAVTTQALGGLALLIVVLGAALFAPVGTFDYWQAWVVLAVFSSAALAMTVYLAKHDPALLARRMQRGPLAEKQRHQTAIRVVAWLAFIAAFLVSAFDHRAGWSRVPPAIVVAGDAIVVVGQFIIFLVFRVNTFTSAIIEVDRDQRVVSTGPYAVVRHPMYAGSLVMLLGVPIALGSWWGVLAVPVMAVVTVWRLLDEEKLLVTNLPGYAEYRDRVKYRLVPGVW